MICNNGLSPQFYINRIEEFLQSKEELTIINLKKYVGISDENFEDLKKDETFNNLIKLLKP